MIKYLGIVIPVFDEEDIIQNVLLEWNEYLIKNYIKYEFIIINDGSTDKSREKILEITKTIKNITIIDKKNSGHGPSCIYGYKHCIETKKFDWVLQIDSDYQCDPVYFSKFLIYSNEYDAVFGNRKIRYDGALRVVISNILMISILFIKFKLIRDSNVPYRLMKTSILKKSLEDFPLSVFLSNIFVSLKISKICTIKWVDIKFRDRMSGSSKTNIIKMLFKFFRFLMDLMRYN
tara:strand:+ start:51 stop:749 length:699 start_codon:yes stop_codon:yes gene_type:complete